MHLIILVGITLSAITALPIPDGQSQSFVPGVFISNEMLKDLQEKADQADSNLKSQTSNSAVSNLNQALRNYDGQLKVSQAYQSNSSPQESQQPTKLQPTVNQVVPSQQPPTTSIIVQPPTTNPQQTILLSPQTVNPQQPTVITQQPSVMNQLPSVPNQQPILLGQTSTGSQQSIVIAQPPSLSNQQQITQPSISNQQPILVSQQPNQQPILVTQAVQPNLVNQQFGQSQNQGTLTMQNGQIVATASQPTLLSASASSANGNQMTLLRTNTNKGSVYTLVPLNNNGQNTVTIGNGNSYLVPLQNVQQVQGSQIYTLSSEK